jgi:hypothetical protein
MVGADAHHASHELLGGGIAHALGDHRQELLHGRQRIHFRDLQPVRGSSSAASRQRWSFESKCR